jgi:hypothetical protein
MRIEGRLTELGLVLPEPMRLPTGVRLLFSFVRVGGTRALVAGHNIPVEIEAEVEISP